MADKTEHGEFAKMSASRRAIGGRCCKDFSLK